MVKPAEPGYAVHLFRLGHRALTEAEEAGGRRGAPTVWASGAGRYEIARGAPVRDGWLRFTFRHGDAAYKELASMSGLAAIATVDCATGRIMGAKFLGRQLGWIWSGLGATAPGCP